MEDSHRRVKTQGAAVFNISSSETGRMAPSIADLDNASDLLTQGYQKLVYILTQISDLRKLALWLKSLKLNCRLVPLAAIQQKYSKVLIIYRAWKSNRPSG